MKIKSYSSDMHEGYGADSRLSGVRQRARQFSGNIDGEEASGGIPISFAALVDHGNVAVLGCFRVRHELIELAELQRSLVAFVVDADRELRCGVATFAHG
jgi:hypothetical protein